MVVARSSLLLQVFSLMSPERFFKSEAYFVFASAIRLVLTHSVFFPTVEGEVLSSSTTDPPPATFRNAQRFLKESNRFSISILTYSVTWNIYISVIKKKINARVFMEGFLEVGFEMGLKGLIEIDWMENLGREEQKELFYFFFQAEDKVLAEIKCMVLWDGQNQDSG